MPGLVCAYGEGPLAAARAAAAPCGGATAVLLAEPRCAILATGRACAGARVAASGGLRLFLWGHLVGSTPEEAADAFARGGPAAVDALDGSFVLAAWDGERLAICTDRVGSRPWFVLADDRSLLAAPEVKCLLAHGRVDRAIVPGSIAAMAVDGALVGESTYHRGIRLLGPARRIVADAKGVRSDRYWRREFRPLPSAPAPPFEEIVREHLAPHSRPVLAFSGGFDSRLLLASARLPVVVWGFDWLEEAGADYQVGARVAEAMGAPVRRRPVDVDRLRDHAVSVVRSTDGLLGHLGNFPEGDAPARELAADHDAILFGHEMFGWGRAARTGRAALERVGVQTGRRMRLLRFFLKREVRGEVLADYERQWRALLEEAGAHACADDLKDHLYWSTRFPRLIAPQAALFWPHLDVVTPWLDRRVLDWTATLPAPVRIEKRGAVAAGQAAFPAAFAHPLNSHHSRVDWASRLRSMAPSARFVVETLLEPDASFDAWFDRRAIEAWLARTTGHRARPPLPLRLRAALLRRLSKPRLAVNLLVLKLWFALRRAGDPSAETPPSLPRRS